MVFGQDDDGNYRYKILFNIDENRACNIDGTKEVIIWNKRKITKEDPYGEENWDS